MIVYNHAIRETTYMIAPGDRIDLEILNLLPTKPNEVESRE